MKRSELLSLITKKLPVQRKPNELRKFKVQFGMGETDNEKKKRDRFLDALLGAPAKVIESKIEKDICFITVESQIDFRKLFKSEEV